MFAFPFFTAPHERQSNARNLHLVGKFLQVEELLGRGNRRQLNVSIIYEAVKIAKLLCVFKSLAILKFECANEIVTKCVHVEHFFGNRLRFVITWKKSTQGFRRFVYRAVPVIART